MAANLISQYVPGGFSFSLDIYAFKEGDAHIYYSPALDISGYGLTDNEARESLLFSIREYLDYGIKKRTLVKDLRAHGWKVRSLRQKKFKAPDLDDMVAKNGTLRDILINRDYSKSRTEVSLS